MNNFSNMEKLIKEVNSASEWEERDTMIERFWKEARDLWNHDRESFQRLFTENCDIVRAIILCAPVDILTPLISSSNINMVDRYGMTPLHAALVKESWELVPILLQHGADVNVIDTSMNVSLNAILYRSQTPLHLAAEKGAPINVFTQLVSPHNVNIQSKYGLTVLHVALINQRMDFVRILLQHGADVNLRNAHNTTPLLSAVKHDAPIDIITQLISPHTVSKQNDRCDSPLNWGVLQNRWELVSVLLRYGADVNTGNMCHPTTLHTAAQVDTPEDIFTQLISRCNINMQDDRGNTALHFAVRFERWDLVPVLLQHGGDFNLANHGNRTPLHVAARRNAPANVLTLLLSHLNINIRDKDGDTALHIAIQKQRWDLVPVLLQHGADPNMLDSPQIDQPLVRSLKASCILTIRCHMDVKSDEAYEGLRLPRKLVDEVKLRPQADYIVARGRCE